ncbi:MAG: hypothetical protein IKZ05_05605 [Clostridia bacterium]|nr:hypothetical protein [Clostridia bacterium]
MSTLKKAGVALVKSLILAILHITFTQLAYFTSYPEENEILISHNAMRHIIVSGVIFVCFLYSFTRMQAVYNKSRREKYLAAEGDVGMLSFILSSADYWTDLLVYAVISTAGYGKLFYFISDIFGEGGMLNSLAVTLPIIAVIGFIARFNATKIWNRTLDADEADAIPQNDKKGKQKPLKLFPTAPTFAAMRFIANSNNDSNPALESEQVTPFDYGVKAMIKSFSLVIVIALLSSLFGIIVYSFISLILVPIFMIRYAKYLGAILFTVIIALPILRRVKAFIRRAQLISKTRKLCKEGKYRLSNVKAPYASLFSSVRGESFNLTMNGETFSCKLMAAKKASRPIVLHEDGIGETIHSITFVGIKWYERRKAFRFGYETKNKQILIFNPSAKFICSEKNGALTELDNGDVVGNYIIYTGTGFTNALDRKTLGVNDNEKNKYKYL